MGDHQSGPAPHQTLQRILDQLLAFGVETAGRLVEDQELGPLKHHASDGYPLALPGTECHTALADDLIISVGKGLDEIGGVSRQRHLFDLRLARLEIPIQEILSDRATEEHGLLGNDPDSSPQVI